MLNICQRFPSPEKPRRLIDSQEAEYGKLEDKEGNQSNRGKEDEERIGQLGNGESGEWGGYNLRGREEAAVEKKRGK